MKQKEKNPSRRLVCQNSRFHVFFQDARFDQRDMVSDYLVVAPKRVSKNLVTGVAVLAVVGRKLALLEIFRPAIDGTNWEIPRGFLEDQDDTHVASVMRELEEETGLRCAAEDFWDLGLIAPDAGILAARVHLFAATRCRAKAGFRTREIGHRRLAMVGMAKFKKMIQESVIQDPSTIAAWCRYILLMEAENLPETLVSHKKQKTGGGTPMPRRKG